MQFDSDELEAMHYKLKYFQVKLFRKTRNLVKADELAREMIEHVSKQLPQPETDAQVVEITEQTPKAYWKYALYASYIQALILSDNCEYKIPREILESFSKPCIKALIEHFYPDKNQDN